MNEMVILDVSHGSCALIMSGQNCAVVDAPIGSLLLNTLEDKGVTKVDAAFISHADKDHMAGILGLLTSETIKLERLYINPDSQKRTKIWKDFLAAVSVAERSGGCAIHNSLTTTLPGKLTIGEIGIKVVAPSASFALAGSGSVDSSGRTISSNATSAVLHVSYQDKAGVMLAGDMERSALETLRYTCKNLITETLLFPHHGGLPGAGDASKFADDVLALVSPNFVVFSNGRRKHDNPRREILAEVLKHGCSLACTQLARNCHSKPIDELPHLESHRALGRDYGECCGGSMTFDLEQSGRRRDGDHAAHQSFIFGSVETPMCIRNDNQ